MEQKKIKIHFIKLNTRYVDAVNLGLKSFEIRKNDRDYHIGDYVCFRMVNDSNKELNHPIKDNLFMITYLIHTPVQMDAYGINLRDDTVIFSIKKVDRKQREEILLAYSKQQ